MINHENFAKVVRQRYDYYIPKFEEIMKNKDKESWNYTAFFFSFSWLVSILTHFICGIYGNYLYFNHCKKKINDNINLDESLKNNNLHRVGGVSIFGLIVVFIIVFISTGIYVKYNPVPF